MAIQRYLDFGQWPDITLQSMIGSVFADLGLATRVSIAAGPLIVAVLLRLILGPNRLTGSLITFTMGWFAVNVLLAPSSEPMRQTLYSLPGRIFR